MPSTALSRTHRRACRRAGVRRAAVAAPGLLSGERVTGRSRPPRPAARRAPRRALVLACFNQTYKLTEPFVSIWLDVLRERPDAVLWLWVPHALARRNLRAFARRRAWRATHRVRAGGEPRGAPGAAAVRRSRARRSPLWISHVGKRRAVGGRASAHVPRDHVRRARRREPVPRGGLPELVTESLADYAAELRRLCGDRDRLEHFGDTSSAGASACRSSTPRRLPGLRALARGCGEGLAYVGVTASVNAESARSCSHRDPRRTRSRSCRPLRGRLRA